MWPLTWAKMLFFRNAPVHSVAYSCIILHVFMFCGWSLDNTFTWNWTMCQLPGRGIAHRTGFCHDWKEAYVQVIQCIKEWMCSPYFLLWQSSVCSYSFCGTIMLRETWCIISCSLLPVSSQNKWVSSMNEREWKETSLTNVFLPHRETFFRDFYTRHLYLVMAS